MPCRLIRDHMRTSVLAIWHTIPCRVSSEVSVLATLARGRSLVTSAVELHVLRPGQAWPRVLEQLGARLSCMWTFAMFEVSLPGPVAHRAADAGPRLGTVRYGKVSPKVRDCSWRFVACILNAANAAITPVKQRRACQLRACTAVCSCRQESQHTRRPPALQYLDRVHIATRAYST